MAALWALFTCLFAATLAGRVDAQATGATATEDGTTITFQVALSDEAYNAWNGSLDDPRFLFPGESRSVPPQAISPEMFMSDMLRGGDANQPALGFNAHTVVGIASCTIEAHYPHAGKGYGGALATKAKADGRCQLTATGEGPLPPESKTWWIAYLRLEQHSGVQGTAIYVRTGHRPTWEQNPGNGYPGTQVFRHGYGCVNGLHKHHAEINFCLRYRMCTSGPIQLKMIKNPRQWWAAWKQKAIGR